MRWHLTGSGVTTQTFHSDVAKSNGEGDFAGLAALVGVQGIATLQSSSDHV